MLKSEAPEQGATVRNAPAILIADDDPAIRLILRHRLEAAGYNVSEAAESTSALAALRTNRFEVALLDIIMPGSGGLEVLSAAQTDGVRTAIIVITAASTMSNAVEAIKRGAHDYLTKPFHNLDLVAAAVERAVEVSAQNAEINRLKTEVGHLVGGEIVGRSPSMQEIYKLIGRLVNNDANVLICGESGTGKELVARAIHFKSERWRAPFVAVNCSAIPQGLLESELFGHERGAFTGATERRAGKFELVGRGTLFLDEISDMPLELQPKLLRAIQEREFSAVGSSEVRRLQARIIAASNQDLEAAVAARRFREDLYFRLRVIPIFLPPLRERREDIPELVDYFIARAARDMGAKVGAASREAMEMLMGHSWPGNVRELENCVLRSALLAPGNIIRTEDISFGRTGAKTANPETGDGSLDQLITRSIRDYLDEQADDAAGIYDAVAAKVERPLIELALERFRGNQVRAARFLGFNRNTLRKKINDLRIVVRKGPAA
ncbi:MAG TPA: sigma-54 dependent transcriptional regulator [Candidatus Binataceae bacterium]|nr:sigma-54 dependent transcriptional regulator [Candidatus Binataceae bacterium]